VPKKPKAEEKRWLVYRMRGKRADWLGTVSAQSEAEAIARAIKEFEIPKPLWNRVLVRQE
jgi:hypothetical protein